MLGILDGNPSLVVVEYYVVESQSVHRLAAPTPPFDVLIGDIAYRPAIIGLAHKIDATVIISEQSVAVDQHACSGIHPYALAAAIGGVVDGNDVPRSFKEIDAC